MSSRFRETIGRVVTDLAIVMVAVPVGLDWLAPAPRGFCGMTPEFHTFTLGLVILAARPTWLILKTLNDAGERWLDERTLSRSRPKPEPPDDI